MTAPITLNCPILCAANNMGLRLNALKGSPVFMESTVGKTSFVNIGCQSRPIKISDFSHVNFEYAFRNRTRLVKPSIPPVKSTSRYPSNLAPKTSGPVICPVILDAISTKPTELCAF